MKSLDASLSSWHWVCAQAPKQSSKRSLGRFRLSSARECGQSFQAWFCTQARSDWWLRRVPWVQAFRKWRIQPTKYQTSHYTSVLRFARDSYSTASPHVCKQTQIRLPLCGIDRNHQAWRFDQHQRRHFLALDLDEEFCFPPFAYGTLTELELTMTKSSMLSLQVRKLTCPDSLSLWAVFCAF